MAKIEKDLKAVSDYASQLFLKDPTLSIDAVARTLADKFKGRTLAKNVLSGIRNEVKKKVEAGHGYKEEGERSPREPRFSNSPKLRETPKNKEKMDTKESEGVDEENDRAHTRDMLPPVPDTASVEDRKRWFDAWVLDHPMATVAEARAALMNRFGVAFGTTYLSSQLRLVKDTVRLDQLQKQRQAEGRDVPSLTRELTRELGAARTQQEAVTIETIVALMEKLGVRKIERLENGAFTYEAMGRLPH